MLLLAAASVVAVDAVTHRKLNGQTPAIRGSVPNQASPAANVGLDSNVHAKPMVAANISAGGMRHEAAKAAGEAQVVNATGRQTARHFLEVVPAPLRERTVAALQEQKRWLPEALRTGHWPKDLFSPYLVWSEKHEAFISNTTNANAWLKRYAGQVSWAPRTRLQTTIQNFALKKFLGGMARAQLPPVITAGSLLAFVRQGAMMTEDADFMTFYRFLQPNLTKSNWWGRCMSSNMPARWKYSEPSKPGYELAFTYDVGSTRVKIDLFFAQEEEEYSATGFWADGKLYKCILPGPTGFAPAMDVNSGSRFFISTMALLNLEYLYGPSWDKPYKKVRWTWHDSPADFSSCDLHTPRSTHSSFSSAEDQKWKKSIPTKAWDAELRHLKQEESDGQKYKAGPEPECY